MIAHHIFLIFTISILCHQVSWVYSHGYFSYPIPRNAYCTNSSCTSNGTLGSQGPVWVLPANSSLSVASLTTQTTCNGSNLLPLTNQSVFYDPGLQGKVAASWPAGSSQTLQIFISQIHTTENQTIYPTDGWQIRYRDGTQSSSTFNAIPFTYANFSTTGPAPGIGFQLGQTVLATITVPPNTTSDGIFQFFWRNNEVGPGVMWLSCVDVSITALSTNLASSKFSIFIALLTTIGISFTV
ncbi:unnamed protein product [Rotaria magnacalcarata]|uniref:Reelin domain-containing protein n=2 Tax=Rotaria magnacalcarata TaxID=392030 RepID=A0A819GIL9_9BILA|nr:unnamed protein product [Rotaria magnacalcarata]CAF3882369.1 unnamed protein product [Rotaria magnacalcarata]CAF4052747.1 unnamed protein product [Rotaria magnacalcarata]